MSHGERRELPIRSPDVPPGQVTSWRRDVGAWRLFYPWALAMGALLATLLRTLCYLPQTLRGVD